MRLGVWVAPYRDAPAAPEEQPMGRAALALEAEGVPVLFGHHHVGGALVGFRARPGRWVEDRFPPDAVYDRFPSRSRPDAYAALVADDPAVARGNPASLIALCADKLACQQALDVRQPPVEGDPQRFAARMAEWGAAFVKPRYGAFGVGVRRVVAGEALPARIVGPTGAEEPALLQAAVPPPAGFAGVACRVLVQRDADGWWADVPVARVSREDPVVNAARGAGVLPLAKLYPSAVDAVVAASVAAAESLAGRPDGGALLEIGVDVALDAALRPWVIEVNGRPRGRLESLLPLDPGWMAAHVAACARPLRALLRRAASRRAVSLRGAP